MSTYWEKMGKIVGTHDYASSKSEQSANQHYVSRQAAIYNSRHPQDQSPKSQGDKFTFNMNDCIDHLNDAPLCKNIQNERGRNNCLQSESKRDCYSRFARWHPLPDPVKFIPPENNTCTQEDYPSRDLMNLCQQFLLTQHKNKANKPAFYGKMGGRLKRRSIRRSKKMKKIKKRKTSKRK